MTKNLALSCLLVAFCLDESLALKAEWIPLGSKTRISPRRSGHMAFEFFGSRKKNDPANHFRPYIFGGYLEEDDQGGSVSRYVKNDLWTFGEGGWTPVEVQPGTDIPRACLVAATATVDDNKAYMFGGWDPGVLGTGGDILDTVYEFDLSSKMWRKLETTLPDGPASRHVAVVLGDDSSSNRIMIHNHRCNDHVWIFDAKEESFVKQATSGTAPSSRGLHAATKLDENKVLFFGGAAQNGVMSNEAFVLDTVDWSWTLVEVTGDCPSPRAAPCLVTYDETCAILYGGAKATETGLVPEGDVWALHLDEKKWEVLCPTPSSAGEGEFPPPRNAASLALLRDTGDGTKDFLLTGGWHPFVKTWDDCFCLRVST